MISIKHQDTILKIGDTVKVKYNLVEVGKTRTQAFEGVLIAIRGKEENKSIIVRRIGDRGIGVERIWPLNSRSIVDIEVKKGATKVRRSKLYYVRNLTGKAAVRT